MKEVHKEESLINRTFRRISILVTILFLSTYTLSFYRPSSSSINFTSAPDRGIDISPLKREPSLEPNTKHLHKSRTGAVASDVQLCSEMGISILSKGGNAADAAVTVALCIGGINSFNSGIGGGAYLVSKKHKEKAISIDAREIAPLKSHKNMFKSNPLLSKIGGLSAGIPGEIKGLYTLFKLQGSGRLSWFDVIDPVIEVLENGWIVSDVLAFAIEADKEFFKLNSHNWEFVFKDVEKRQLLRSGDLIKRVQLANTLKLIANNGSDAIFYDPSGPIASNLIKTVNENGGIFQDEDFLNYDVKVYDALHTNYLGNDVYTCAGSCSGPALISGLKIINKYGEHIGGDMDPLATHRLIETMKWMASGRSRLGDPFETINNNEYIISDEWIEFAQSKINDNKTLGHWSDYKPAYEANEPHGTTHFSIVDSEENAVSVTSTINLLFGSLVHDVNTSIILNNEMDDFSTPGIPNAFGVEPSIYNFIKPGKRPLSSTVPTIIVDELQIPDLIIGAAGGSRITTAVFQAIVRIYSYGFPLLETLSYPRLHHQLIPNRVEHEIKVGSDILDSLKEKGHEVFEDVPKTAMNAIRRWRVEWHAVSDYWRKRGEAAVL